MGRACPEPWRRNLLSSLDKLTPLPAVKMSSGRQGGKSSSLEVFHLGLESEVSFQQNGVLKSFNVVLSYLERDIEDVKVTHAGSWQGWLLCTRKCTSGTTPGIR